LQHRIHEVGDFKRWVATALGMKKRSVPPYNFGGTLSARGATCAMRTLVSAPSNRHGLSLCHKYNPKQLRWFMLVPATGQFGVPRSKACAQARRYLVLSQTAHFRNALKCVGASGRLPSGNLQIKAVDCRILLRFVVLYYALFSAFGATSPFLREATIGLQLPMRKPDPSQLGAESASRCALSPLQSPGSLVGVQTARVMTGYPPAVLDHAAGTPKSANFKSNTPLRIRRYSQQTPR
jgi:hypothetical protein